MIQTKTHRKHLFTPLRYPGGKTSLFEFFDEVIRFHDWKNVTYVEPYAGGAGAALSLLLLGKVKKVVINDFDPAIFAFWHSILNDTDAFIERIHRVPATVLEWEKQKLIYKHPKEHSLLDLGFATFYLNRTNRSGILNGGPIGGKKQTGDWKIDARYNRENLAGKISLIAKEKRNINVTKQDGLKVIEKYANRPNAFLYVDPPYYKKGADLYLNSFKSHHHEQLAEVLNKHSQAKWILTYDNVAEIRQLYLDRIQDTFSLKYSAHHASLASELVVLSDAVSSKVLL